MAISDVAVNRREAMVARAFRLRMPKAVKLAELDHYRTIREYGDERDRLAAD